MAKRVVIVDRAGPGEHARPWLDAFEAGLRNPLHPRSVPIDIHRVAEHELTPCDVAVFWSHRPAAWIEQQRATAGAHYVVLERGFIGDRKQWASVGLDGLNGRATWPVADFMDLDSWERFNAAGVSMRRWQSRKPHAPILILGQCAGDEATKDIDLRTWYVALCGRLRVAFPQAAIWFRPHPERPDDTCMAADLNVSPRLRIQDQLTSAQMAATWNSSAAVVALLAGVPVYAGDWQGTVARNMVMERLEPGRLFKPDRGSWARALPWSQWSIDELAQGWAWSAVDQHLGKIDAIWRI